MGVFHKHHHKIVRIETALLKYHPVMKLFSLIASAALAQVGNVLGSPHPGPDRPQKQADYAALSHPANTRTVMASVTLDDPVPLEHHQVDQQQQFQRFYQRPSPAQFRGFY